MVFSIRRIASLMETMTGGDAPGPGTEILEKQMPIHPERFIEHCATDTLADEFPAIFSLAAEQPRDIPATKALAIAAALPMPRLAIAVTRLP